MSLNADQEHERAVEQFKMNESIEEVNSDEGSSCNFTDKSELQKFMDDKRPGGNVAKCVGSGVKAAKCKTFLKPDGAP